MDLPCVQWQDHVAQKWISIEPELKDRFTSLCEVDDVFKCALTLTTQEDLDFLNSISESHSVHKIIQQAAKCREKGNCSFRSRDYTAAALHYSQGVCSAPQGSEQLSLCYANRSAALYHLQHYQECLDDIDKALKNDYPAHLSHKLEDRRTQCLKHLSGAKKAVKAPSVGHLSGGMGPQATVCFNPEKGRHLVAAQGIAAGEEILSDRPYSFVLIPGVQGKKGEPSMGGGVLGTEHRCCHRCLAQTLSPVPCDGCSYSRYCSTECQQDAWEEHHRWECPLGAELTAMGVMSQLALRVALKAGFKNLQAASKPIGDKNTKPVPSRESSESSPSSSHYGDSYLSVFHLLHHLDRHSPGLRFLNAITAATLCLKLSRSGPWTLGGPSAGNSPSTDDWSPQRLMGSAVLRHILQLRCNAQAILMMQDTGAADSPVQASREVRLATAIFPSLSLLNHSCCPNTSLVFRTGAPVHPAGSNQYAGYSRSETRSGVTVTVRAAKRIAAGQEILHCYGPHSSRMVTQDRRRLLEGQYYFLCQCEACSLTPEESAEGTQHWAAAGGGGAESGLRCGKCKGSLKKSSMEEGAGFICSKSSCAHWVSSFEVSLRLQEIRADREKAVDLMERDRPGEALELLSGAQCRAGKVLARTHPLRGELADAAARAHATMGDWNKAASHLERSAVAIHSQYGDDSIELGQQLFKLAQLHFNGGARGPALAIIPEVRRLLQLHCGPHGPELQELKAMEDCLLGYSK